MPSTSKRRGYGGIKHDDSHLNPRSAHCRVGWRGYAMTLLVLGRTAEAAAHIDRLLKHEPIDNLPHFREEMTDIARVLAEDPASIVPRLHKRASENRSALGLEGEERR